MKTIETTEDKITEQTTYFNNCWPFRNDSNPQWRRHYRHFAKQAISELRFLKGKPRKAVMFAFYQSYPKHSEYI